MYYPNQKCITVMRDEVKKNPSRTYVVIYKENLEEAMKNLSPATFKVYVCLVSNKNDFQLEFSPKVISEKTDLCEATCRKSLKELEMKNYLENTNNNFYNFYEVRQTVYIPMEEKRKTFTDPITGRVKELSYRELMNEVGFERANMIWNM